MPHIWTPISKSSLQWHVKFQRKRCFFPSSSVCVYTFPTTVHEYELEMIVVCICFVVRRKFMRILSHLNRYLFYTWLYYTLPAHSTDGAKFEYDCALTLHHKSFVVWACIHWQLYNSFISAEKCTWIKYRVERPIHLLVSLYSGFFW